MDYNELIGLMQQAEELIKQYNAELQNRESAVKGEHLRKEIEALRARIVTHGYVGVLSEQQRKKFNELISNMGNIKHGVDKPRAGDLPGDYAGGIKVKKQPELVPSEPFPSFESNSKQAAPLPPELPLPSDVGRRAERKAALEIAVRAIPSPRPENNDPDDDARSDISTHTVTAISPRVPTIAAPTPRDLAPGDLSTVAAPSPRDPGATAPILEASGRPGIPLAPRTEQPARPSIPPLPIGAPQNNGSVSRTAQFRTLLEQPYSVISDVRSESVRAVVEQSDDVTSSLTGSRDSIILCAEIFEMARRASAKPGCKPEITIGSNTGDPELAATFYLIAKHFADEGLVTLKIDAAAQQVIDQGLALSGAEIKINLAERFSAENSAQFVRNFIAIYSTKLNDADETIANNYMQRSGLEQAQVGEVAGFCKNNGGLFNALHGHNANLQFKDKYGCIEKLADSPAYGQQASSTTTGSGLLGEEKHALVTSSAEEALGRIKQYQQPLASENNERSRPRM
jgi:hypothetical protein